MEMPAAFSVSVFVYVVVDTMNERQSGVCKTNARFSQSVPSKPQASEVFFRANLWGRFLPQLSKITPEFLLRKCPYSLIMY